MTEDQMKVLVRAAEAGHFRPECAAWWNSDVGSTSEAAASRAFGAKAVELVGDPSVAWAIEFRDSQQALDDLSDEERAAALRGAKVWSAAREEMWPEDG